MLDEAFVQQVIKAPIEKPLKTYKSSTEELLEIVHEVRGPGRDEILVECLAKSKGMLTRVVSHFVKKCGYENRDLRGGGIEFF